METLLLKLGKRAALGGCVAPGGRKIASSNPEMAT